MRPTRTPIALALLLLASGCDRRQEAQPRTEEVRALRVEGELPRDDPADGAWRRAPAHVVKLLLQDVTDPRLREASVETVSARALNDGQWLAIRLEWRDDQEDDLVGPGRFSDAAAVQFPIAAGGAPPNSNMGDRDERVRIAYWRAAWAAEGDPVERLRPHATTDHYPPEAAPTEEGQARLKALYSPAKAVGNPLATRPEGPPVQRLLAEGYGTLSPDPEARADGGGAWNDGTWTVVIAVPLDESPDGSLRPGVQTQIALAIWDGDAGNVGSRKMRTVWIPLVIEEAR